MVERRSIIFSKLLDGGRALSAFAAAAAAEATAAGGSGPAPGGLSPLTEAAAGPGGWATAEGPTVVVAVVVLGVGGSDVLGAELMPSAGGCGWGWFCCCPGTW